MQRIGAGVLVQWKRAVTSLGSAGDLSLDFSFFPHHVLCVQTVCHDAASGCASILAEKLFATTC